MYNTKVREGKIILVDEHNLDATCEYFVGREGIDVRNTLTTALRGTTEKVMADKVKAPTVVSLKATVK